ncbi:MAG TPA: O-succinylhomoserine sulfhydrylase [Alphaproteobacteria bacterium]|nr:O-succinylhomoserine sulfhydrylase [Alphaproteobacteria bacterium]
MKSTVTNETVKSWRLKTKLVRGGTRRSQFGETSEAIYATSGFVYDEAETAEARFKGEAQGFTYSRLANPTVAMFEDRMALIDNAEIARGTASGMSAVSTALLCQLRAGDHVVSSSALFGSCLYILEDVLPRFGITVSFVTGSDLDAWKAAIKPETRVVFLESPANPTLDIIDIRAVSKLAHEAGARVVVDNVFATPLLQKPLELGADVVAYSATKHIDGQGRCLGGAIVCSKQFFDDRLNQFLRHTGPTMSPFNAWVLLKGLETLELRISRMCENAVKIADFLADNGAVTRVRYPGRKDHPQHDLAMSQMSAGGTIVTFDAPGGREAAFRLMNALQIVDISNNLGDSKTLITHPASTTHQRLSQAQRDALEIGPGMMRISVGLEDVDDLTEDLAQAIKAM